MSDEKSRWRTPFEIAFLSLIVYFFLGSPGLPKGLIKSSSPAEQDAPVAKAKIESLVYPDKDLVCNEHDVDIHIFSYSPLVIYVDGFLSEQEVEHLVDISSSKWQVSTFYNGGVETTDDSIRKSEKALIERDTTVQCVEQRALSIQGWPQDTYIERLWTQRYNVSGHYAHHYDWATASKTSRRVSTFMVYLHADCEGGGTNFPRLAMPADRERWCRFIECDDDGLGLEGVTFKPRKGAAVFWMNFDVDGRGYKETYHAGLPVTKGTKIGLNIWSWYQQGHSRDD